MSKDVVQLPVCFVCRQRVDEDDDSHPWFVDNKVYFIWPLHNNCAEFLRREP